MTTVTVHYNGVTSRRRFRDPDRAARYAEQCAAAGCAVLLPLAATLPLRRRTLPGKPEQGHAPAG